MRLRILTPLIVSVVSILVCWWIGGNRIASRQPMPNATSGSRSGRITNTFELVPQQFSTGDPQTDANCLLLNPQWGWQVDHGSDDGLAKFPNSISTDDCKEDNFSDCSGNNGQPQRDPAPTLCPMCQLGKRWENRIHGHVNWFPATYTGPICFHNFSYPDMDYTFSLRPKEHAGLTRWNAPSVPDGKGKDPDKDKSYKCGKSHKELCLPEVFHVEFDSKETIERFVSKEWTEFRKLASPCFQELTGCKPKEARKKIELKRAVVVGLVGLDSEHNIYSELHPVFAIAIELQKGTDNDNANVKDNTWLVFARTSGDEGACTSGQLYPLIGPSHTPLKEVKILIPPPENHTTTGASIVAGTEINSNNGSSVKADYYPQLFSSDPTHPFTDNNQGVLLTFDLSSCTGPDDDNEPCVPLIEGVVHIDWNAIKNPSPAALLARQAEDRCTIPEIEEEEQKRSLRSTSKEKREELYQILQENRARGLASMRPSQFPSGPLASAAPREKCPATLATSPPGDDYRYRRWDPRTKPTNVYQRIIDILGRSN